MNTDSISDASQLEINISNTNAQSQIVLNDLRLLELIHKYPFLFCKAVAPQNDEDYEKWGWEEITKAFNISYEGLKLTAPFSVEELQSRWEVLRSICPTLAKTSDDVAVSLRYIVGKIQRLMNVKPPAHFRKFGETQQFILSQLPLLDQLTTAQQRQLEVEVLDVLFREEQEVRSGHRVLSEAEQLTVQCEYDDFLRTIRLKELDGSRKSSNGKSSAMPNMVNNHENNLVTSNMLDSDDSPSESTNPSTPLSIIKAEPPDQQQDIPTPIGGDLRLRYVPLKSVKSYVKRVRVKVKRMDFDKYMPPSSRLRRR